MDWLILLLECPLNINLVEFPIAITALNFINMLGFQDQIFMDDIFEDDVLELFI